MDRLVAAYTRWVLKWRVTVVLLTTALGLGLGIYATKLDFNNDYRMYFDEDNPQLQDYEYIQDVYSRDDRIIFVISPWKGQIYSRPCIELVRKLTNAAWKLPYATRVDSVTNYMHSTATEDELIVGPLVPNDMEITRPALYELREIVKKTHGFLARSFPRMNKSQS